MASYLRMFTKRPCCPYIAANRSAQSGRDQVLTVASTTSGRYRGPWTHSRTAARTDGRRARGRERHLALGPSYRRLSRPGPRDKFAHPQRRQAAKMADASLIGVIVGGGLAICGGLVSGGITVINQWLDRADRKKKLRAEKLEELVRSIYDFDHWMGRNKNYYLFGATEKLEPSPFARVEATPVLLQATPKARARRARVMGSYSGIPFVSRLQSGMAPCFSGAFQRQPSLWPGSLPKTAVFIVRRADRGIDPREEIISRPCGGQLIRPLHAVSG